MSARGIESLYPFLYEGSSDVAAVLEQVRRSTEEKALEIVALRKQAASEMGPRLAACAEAMAASFASGGRLFAFGNGGSSTDARAVAQLFLHPPRGRALPALSLTNDIAVITALANDVGFDVVFARQVVALGSRGDIAAGFSTSGNSGNVLRALEEAAGLGMITVGFAGSGGGRMAESAAIRFLFVVPSSSIHRIQEVQTTLYDVLWELVQQALGRSAP